MPNVTPRLGLLQELVGDIPAVITNAAANSTTLDNSGRHFSGTFANRASAVSRPLGGDIYYATDTGLYYLYSGVAWQTLPGFGQDFLLPVVQNTSTTMTAGFRYFASAGTVMTLPPPTAGLAVGVTAGPTASGTSPVTVSYGSGGGGIYGQGLANPEARFLLGTPEATVVLSCSDGANWAIVSGVRDTGWVPLTLGVGAQASANGSDVAASRVVGNRGMLRGAYVRGAILSGGASAITAAGHYNPPGTFTQRTFNAFINGGQMTSFAGKFSTGTIFIVAFANGSGGIQAGDDGVNPIWLEGIEWSYRT